MSESASAAARALLMKPAPLKQMSRVLIVS